MKIFRHAFLSITIFCVIIVFAISCDANPQSGSLAVIKKQETEKGTCFFISPSGSDENPGTKDKPFASLEAARDAIRNIKKTAGYPSDGITVYLRGGIYERKKTFELGAEDSGTAANPLVYQSYPGETAQVAGGRLIPATAFTPASPDFRNRITDSSARRHILQADLKVMGITDYGSLQPRSAVDFGSPTHYVVAPLELFVDGKAMTLARYPNRDEINPRGSSVDSARIIIDKDANGKPKQYQSISLASVPASYGDGDEPGLAPILALDRIKKWQASPEDAYIAGGLVRTYSFLSRKISAVDSKNGTLSFETPVPLFPTYNQTTLQQFHFINVPEELDTPGEYYLDRKSGILYLYPPKGWNSKSEILVSMLNNVLVSLENCSHVRLRGLTLEATRSSGVYISGGEDNVIENCEIRNVGLVGVQIGQGYDAATRKLLPRLPGEYRHALCTAMESAAREGRHPSGGSALNRDGGRANGLSNCRVHDIGCGGVLLGGGDRKTLEPAGNFVRNSEICHTDRLIDRYSEAIVVDGVGNKISGNYLHDSDAGILYIHGNEHVIEYNEISKAIKTSSDCGAIEIRQNPSQLGNRIRFNYIHDTSRLNVNAHTNAIYLDNESHGMEIFGNVFQRIGGRSVDPYGRVVISVNGGHEHVIANNLFLDNSGGKIGDGHELEKTQAVFATRRIMLKGDVDVTQPPYSTRYPKFLKIYNGGADIKLYNEVYNNVLVGCGSGVGESRYPDAGYRHHNLETGENPGFVNEADGDYTLRPDSRVFKEIPGFQAIPFEKMRQAEKWRDLNGTN